MLDGLPIWKGQGLDFYQAHWYDYMSSGNWCARCTDYATVQARYGLDAPIVIGELYAAPESDALERFEDFYAKGFAGAWPWSLFWDHTEDRLRVDLAAAATFSTRHTDLGPGSGAGNPGPTATRTPTATPTRTPTPSGQSCRSASLSASPASPQSVGVKVSFTASATGCNPAEFQYWVSAPNRSQQLGRGWGGPIWSPATSALAPGQYRIEVRARRRGSTAASEATSTLTYQLLGLSGASAPTGTPTRTPTATPTRTPAPSGRYDTRV
jgi:hypothetical protein